MLQKLLDLRDYSTLLGLCVGIASFTAALFISWRQFKAGKDLKSLVDEVKQRLFGTIEGFDDLYHKAIQILEQANEIPQSEVGIMLYWLWFGADTELRNNEYKLASLKPNQSNIRKLLAIRRERGYQTRVVLLEPKGQRMRDFLRALRDWQRSKESTQTRLFDGLTSTRTNQANVNPNEDSDGEDLNGCIENYRKDVEEFSREVQKTPDTKFRKLVKKEAVPMIMFALKRRGSGGCCLVCLNEIESLTSHAPVGGFYSEDSKIVDIVYGQIERIGER
ncbi:hypothetical protein HS121_01910 [bacterium]|nr:hypothetical protein [bacterium]